MTKSKKRSNYNKKNKLYKKSKTRKLTKRLTKKTKNIKTKYGGGKKGTELKNKQNEKKCDTMTGNKLSSGTWKKVYSLIGDETKVISLRKVIWPETRSKSEFQSDIKIFRNGGLLPSLAKDYNGPIAEKDGKCTAGNLELCGENGNLPCNDNQEIDYFTSSKFTYSLDRFVETAIFRNYFKTFKDKFKDCLVFLQQMHKIKVGHFDLKEENIGVYMNGESLDKIILMDWGTAAKEEIAQKSMNFFGTPDYIDNEMDQFHNNTVRRRLPDILKSDVYSIGIVLVNIFVVASLVSEGDSNIFGSDTTFEKYIEVMWKIFGEYIDEDGYAAIKKTGLKNRDVFEELLKSLETTDGTNMLSKNEIPKLVDLVENMLKQHRKDRFDMNKVINHEFWTTQ